jgi:hypothetical protein
LLAGGNHAKRAHSIGSVQCSYLETAALPNELEEQAGVTIYFIDEKIDAGDYIGQCEFDIWASLN